MCTQAVAVCRTGRAAQRGDIEVSFIRITFVALMSSRARPAPVTQGLPSRVCGVICVAFVHEPVSSLCADMTFYESLWSLWFGVYALHICAACQQKKKSTRDLAVGGFSVFNGSRRNGSRHSVALRGNSSANL